MDSWNIEYEKGYRHALLDLSNYLRDIKQFTDRELRSKKQMETFVVSLCQYLLQNRLALDDFRMYGGKVDVTVSLKEENKGEVTAVGCMIKRLNT